MIPSRFRIAGVIAAAALVAAGCSSSGSTPAASGAVPADKLVKAGTLTVCSDTSYPPQESLDSSNQAIGSDIELAAEIAKRMNLTLVVKSTTFDSIIPALTGASCDVSISAQSMFPSRLEQIDMIPYFDAGQEFVVLKGNPNNIKTVDDLCGQTVAAEKGTVEAAHIDGTGDYTSETGLSPQCVAKGKPAITLKQFDKDTDALLALQAGTVIAHFTDEPVAGFEVANGQGKFEVVPGINLDRTKEGIGVTKNNTVLRDAVKNTLQAMMDDGTYLTILKKWGIESGAVSSTAS